VWLTVIVHQKNHVLMHFVAILAIVDQTANVELKNINQSAHASKDTKEMNLVVLKWVAPQTANVHRHMNASTDNASTFAVVMHADQEQSALECIIKQHAFVSQDLLETLKWHAFELSVNLTHNVHQIRLVSIKNAKIHAK
jgi:DhnA family fructose-bisphosphate aldolase class Ia